MLSVGDKEHQFQRYMVLRLVRELALLYTGRAKAVLVSRLELAYKLIVGDKEHQRLQCMVWDSGEE